MRWHGTSRSLVAGLTVAAALGGAGCGDSEDRFAGDGPDEAASTRQQLNEVMNRFRAAFAVKDGEKGCALLAKETAKQIALLEQERQKPPASCVRGFEALASGDISEDLTPRKLRYRIASDTATVSGWVSHDEERQTARFVKEQGSWKVLEWFAS